MLRLATKDDLFYLVELFHKFRVETEYEAATNFDKLPSFLEYAIENDDFLVLIWEEEDTPVGFMIGQVAGSPFCDDIAAVEHAWYMDKDYRRGSGGMEMLKAYEFWARKVKNAHHITMVCVHNIKDLGPFYKRMGYKLTESTYHKRNF